MRYVLSLLMAGSVCLLGACAHAPRPTLAPPGLFHDTLLSPPAEHVSTDEVFSVSPAMKHYLAVDIAGQLRTEGAQTGLIDALYRRAQLRLEYDAVRTKNAAEAFATRSGNCLSLVLMTAAFAKELKLPVHYQSAFLEETLSRSGDLLFASGHVNISVGRRIMDAGTTRDLSPLTIDFLPPEDIRRMRTRDIEEATVVAMFGAWNTLGVIYLRHADLAEAAATRTRLAAVEPDPPFHFFNLGIEATKGSDYLAARDLFSREVARADYYHEFHFWLGVADWQLGDEVAAKKHLALGIENSITRGQHDLYAAKLAWLQSHRHE